MSRDIRLFPTYSQRENQTTNHCLLILKMLYEENPKFLSEVLSYLLDEEFSGIVGVKFFQQKRVKGCIPDGEIAQEPFSILIETKIGNNFGKQQLSAHLEALKKKQGRKVLIALGNFECEEFPRNQILEEIATSAKSNDIFFACVSFEKFLQSLQLNHLPKNLADAIVDLSEYFDEENLLPSWKYRLDVVNCAQTFEQIIQQRAYICPAIGGHYNHRRSLYFGMYRSKRVEQIASIDAVIDLESDAESMLKWKNVNLSNESLISMAQERYRSCDVRCEYPARVFVLGELHPTTFSKSSPGGMQGTKQYFDIGNLAVKDAAELATKLAGKTWDNY
ncbi:hypothetical protein LEP3755_57180 [Leptolyngbya sp. NIES-3755]|nr:hypothetical protein LEP3755_57180 [Leptolyngbya sp. NIES-3755]